MQAPETSTKPKKTKTFSEHFNRFATTTAFHGFIQYEQSTNWIKQSLWLALILLCTGLTIRDLRASLKQFFDEELQSMTTIVRNLLSKRVDLHRVQCDSARLLWR